MDDTRFRFGKIFRKTVPSKTSGDDNGRCAPVAFAKSYSQCSRVFQRYRTFGLVCGADTPRKTVSARNTEMQTRAR